MFLKHFIQAVIVGLSIAAPMGPVGLLCLKRSLSDGRLYGLVSGLGAAAADAFCGALAAFSLTAILGMVDRYHHWLQGVGGIVLFGFGILLFRTEPRSRKKIGQEHVPSLRVAFLSTFALTLANPVTLLSFVAVVTALGLGTEATPRTFAIPFIAGIFIGSTLWWIILSLAAGWFRQHLTPRIMTIINRCAASIIMLFGLWELFRLFYP